MITWSVEQVVWMRWRHALLWRSHSKRWRQARRIEQIAEALVFFQVLTVGVLGTARRLHFDEALKLRPLLAITIWVLVSMETLRTLRRFQKGFLKTGRGLLRRGFLETKVFLMPGLLLKVTFSCVRRILGEVCLLLGSLQEASDVRKTSGSWWSQVAFLRWRVHDTWIVVSPSWIFLHVRTSRVVLWTEKHVDFSLRWFQHHLDFLRKKKRLRICKSFCSW